MEGFVAGAEYVKAFSFETASAGISGLHHVPSLNWYGTSSSACGDVVMMMAMMMIC